MIDARKGPWKVARSTIRQVNVVCSGESGEELAQLIVLRPDAFWDKQRVESCTSAHSDKVGTIRIKHIFRPLAVKSKYYLYIQIIWLCYLRFFYIFTMQANENSIII